MASSPGRDTFSTLCSGIVEAGALGILVDNSSRSHYAASGCMHALAAALYRVASCLEHGFCSRYPPLCADCDRSSHPLKQISFMLLPTFFFTPSHYACCVRATCQGNEIWHCCKGMHVLDAIESLLNKEENDVSKD